MKKLMMLCAALCFAAAVLAEDKMSLDLKITNNPYESMFYFNGTGTGRFEYEGQQLETELEIDFEHPADGRYGELTIYDAVHRVVERYAITKVEILNDATCKRVTLKGIEGTRISHEANIDFHRDGDRNYSLLIFPLQGSRYFNDINRVGSWLEFDSQLHIAPRVKSAEELAQEEMIRKADEARKEADTSYQSRRKARKRARETIGALVGILTTLFAIWMMRRAARRGLLLYLLFFMVLGWLTTFPPFLLLPVLPAYFWWYRKLYDEAYASIELDEMFRRIFYWSCGLLGLLFYELFGAIAIGYVFIWFAVGYIVYLLIFFPHMNRYRCPHCYYYGATEIVNREKTGENIFRTITRRNVYSHTEERWDRTIEWYRQKHNERVEADEHFCDHLRCPRCHELFTTTFTRTKTLSDRDY